MLVLSRKKDQSIIIGDNLIRIKIVDSNYQNVRVAIEAPKNLSVHREEIYYKIKGIAPPPPPVIEKKTRTIDNGDFDDEGRGNK